ncbi:MULTISPECIES: hypothetical protein [Deefgea]|uniref:Uncharacterized protein n=1 Tax=Deefgea chitinilytica TaxID=570276 RepID=A0ABS2CDV6_9NEIS|nr:MULTISPECIES: hypothetical protein [Deefgea]MBM5572227.1 hypothetical protein [Deefgea chitinilytica]MBM9889462.1 hypothetical protein [Deefgea sp. CFH1-16]
MSITTLIEEIHADIKQRYKGMFFAPFVISFLAVHWKVVVFFFYGRFTYAEAIKFIEENVTLNSILYTLISVLFYIVALPWLEVLLLRFSSTGRKKRSELQATELEQIKVKRQAIADAIVEEQQARVKLDKSRKEIDRRKADADLAKLYESILSEQSLEFFVNEIGKGIFGSQYQAHILNYLSNSNYAAGKFFDVELESLHKKFIATLSELNSSLESRGEGERVYSYLKEIGNRAIEQKKAFRLLVREKLDF